MFTIIFCADVARCHSSNCCIFDLTFRISRRYVRLRERNLNAAMHNGIAKEFRTSRRLIPYNCDIWLAIPMIGSVCTPQNIDIQMLNIVDYSPIQRIGPILQDIDGGRFRFNRPITTEYFDNWVKEVIQYPLRLHSILKRDCAILNCTIIFIINYSRGESNMRCNIHLLLEHFREEKYISIFRYLLLLFLKHTLKCREHIRS